MNRRLFSLNIFLTLAVILFLSCFAGILYPSTGTTEFKPVAEVIINSNGINWMPKINYSQLILSVSRPDGTVFQKTFESGSTPYIDISSIISNSTPCDGSYTYELRVVPVDVQKIKEELVAIRKREGGSTNIDGLQIAEYLSQSGHFRISGGSILSSTATEERYSTQDVVHADDVIITGSLCIGYDCATDGSESFGFDTIKLKENNIRILFDDTSTTAGFPANDWRLIANDSASGGGNYFAIEDATNSKTPFKVEAGARNSALYVSSNGRVGIGTATPVLNLHILQGDTPSLRLDQDTSSGWTAQVWDIAGNESNFFVRDVTGGSKLPLRIQPGTPTNTITMKSDGKVGIGTWSPAYPMELDTTGTNASIAIKRTDGATNYINATDSYANFGSVSNHPLRLVVNSAWRMRLDSDNSLTMANGASLTAGGTWTNASSRSLKENIQDLSTVEALDALNKLNPVKYNYKVDKNEKHVGFIAEDAPELVATKDHKGMSPMDVVAVLTKIVQQQQQIISDQQKKMDEFQEKLNKLENEKK